MEEIEVRNLTFSYRKGQTVLDHISFTAGRGEYIGLAGDSGCGKSTLCQILAGIIPNAVGGDLSGDVCFRGVSLRNKKLSDIARMAGYVMQDPLRQIVTTAVEDELAFAPENFCLPVEEILSRVEEALELFSLKDFRLCDPGKLSGGQLKLVAIAAVWTMQPDILILDEPYSNLDKDGQKMVQRAIQLLRQSGKTILIAEHHLSFLEDADRVLWLEYGKIREETSVCEIRKLYESYSQ